MPVPKRFGFCDAVMGRPCESPWRDFKRQSEYLKGYMEGKANANTAN